MMGRRQGHVSAAPITRPERALLEMLNDSERRQYMLNSGSYLDITGSMGGRYRLYIQGHIVEYRDGAPVKDICAHLPYGSHLHPALNMLAVKLLIQSDEERFLKLRYRFFDAPERVNQGADYARVVYDEREQPRADVPF